MSSFKKVILGKFFIYLAALLTEQFTHKYCIFFLPHSLPLNALLLLYVVTKIKCGSPLIWLSVKSRSDFPKLCVFTLFQLRLALLYTVCQCLIISQFSTCRQCRPKSAICTKRSCDIVFMKMKVIWFCLRKTISGSYLEQKISDLVFKPEPFS